jgi:CheY-like chemotaxis protein/HPt (histidine-containing phosphotransfer) domain-containing protein
MGQRDDIRKMEEIGFSSYLTKPVRQSDLFDCLAAVLAGQNMWQAMSSPVLRANRYPVLNQMTGRILLAEDNITNQNVAVGILKKMGLRAEAVADGEEAVKALETIHYDLVLMDVQMPVMDGLEATRRIRDSRSAVKNHRIPVIAMTAGVMQNDREQCLNAGMNDYVAKPVSPHALAEVLGKWLPKEKNEGGKKNTDSGAAAAYFNQQSSAIFDRAAMMTLLMDDADLIRTVTECFLEDIPRQLAVLKGCLEAGDAAGLERQAHSIKSAAANVGGKRLQAEAAALEKVANGGDLTAVALRMAELETQFVVLRQAMTEGG